MERLLTILPSICFAAIGYAIVFALQPAPENPAVTTDDAAFVNAGAFRGYLLGGEGLAADWYWIKALQHVGDKMALAQGDIDLENLRDLQITHLYPYLNAATDLDPNFLAPYSYGAVVLPAIDREQAIAIAEKGIQQNPGQWRLYQHLGYIHWRAGEYENAADAYSRGAEIEDAPQFMRLMAALMRTDAGSRTTARSIYQQIAADTSDEASTAFAKSKLSELDRLDAVDEIDRALDDWRSLNGRCVDSLSQLAPILIKTSIADNPELRIDTVGKFVDSSAKPYVLNREECTIRRERKQQ